MSERKSAFINWRYYFGFQHEIKIIAGWKREIIFKSRLSCPLSILFTRLFA